MEEKISNFLKREKRSFWAHVHGNFEQKNNDFQFEVFYDWYTVFFYTKIYEENKSDEIESFLFSSVIFDGIEYSFKKRDKDYYFFKKKQRNSKIIFYEMKNYFWIFKFKKEIYKSFKIISKLLKNEIQSEWQLDVISKDSKKNFINEEYLIKSNNRKIMWKINFLNHENFLFFKKGLFFGFNNVENYQKKLEERLVEEEKWSYFRGALSWYYKEFLILIPYIAIQSFLNVKKDEKEFIKCLENVINENKKYLLPSFFEEKMELFNMEFSNLSKIQKKVNALHKFAKNTLNVDITFLDKYVLVMVFSRLKFLFDENNNNFDIKDTKMENLMKFIIITLYSHSNKKNKKITDYYWTEIAKFTVKEIINW